MDTSGDMMKIKGAIFDMDGTLVDSLMFWDVIWELFGKSYLGQENYRIDPALDAAVRTMTLKECAKATGKFFDLRVTDRELFEFFNKGLIDFYQSHAALKNGVPEFLERLKKAGIPMCIASATDHETVEKVASFFGLDRYMKAVVSCADEDVMAGKDHPRVYQKALSILQTEPEETAVFEDSYVALETARRMGLLTVGLFDRYNYGQDRLKKTADYYIAEGHILSEIADFII